MGNRIGILLGDAAGIGPEIVVKTLSKRPTNTTEQFLIIGDYTVFRKTKHFLNSDINPTVITETGTIEAVQDPIVFLDLKTLKGKPYAEGETSIVCGQAVLTELSWAVKLAKQNIINGLFFAPLNKYSMHTAGSKYTSEKNFFVDALGCIGSAYEINIFDNIWTSRVTSHIPLREVADALSTESILDAISSLANLLKLSGFKKFAIYVAGLNPHGGDSGLLGNEETEIIAPAVKMAQENGVNAKGPFSPDTIFVSAKKNPISGIVTMYHDQGQIAMKLIGFDRGITYQAGFPIPIVTPAHGSAFDIAGKGIANEAAGEKALDYLCKRLYR